MRIARCQLAPTAAEEHGPQSGRPQAQGCNRAARNHKLLRCPAPGSCVLAARPWGCWIISTAAEALRSAVFLLGGSAKAAKAEGGLHSAPTVADLIVRKPSERFSIWAQASSGNSRGRSSEITLLRRTFATRIMPRTPIVGGNWKCNPDSKSKLDALIENINKCDTAACEVYVCPSPLHVDCEPRRLGGNPCPSPADALLAVRGGEGLKLLPHFCRPGQSRGSVPRPCLPPCPCFCAKRRNRPVLTSPSCRRLLGQVQERRARDPAELQLHRLRRLHRRDGR